MKSSYAQARNKHLIPFRIIFIVRCKKRQIKNNISFVEFLERDISCLFAFSYVFVCDLLIVVAENNKNSLVSSCPGLFLDADGRVDDTRALFSLIVAASTVFWRLKLLPAVDVTAPPVTAVAWLWFVALPGLGAPPNVFFFKFIDSTPERLNVKKKRKITFLKKKSC